ncbi:MAG: Hsp20/alpha crystallin family protein [Steroidobacteraceae bacterium]
MAPHPTTPSRTDRARARGQGRTYRVENSYGTFTRSFSLPDNITPDAIRCESKDGILSVHIPKAEQKTAEGNFDSVGHGRSAQSLETHSCAGYARRPRRRHAAGRPERRAAAF